MLLKREGRPRPGIKVVGGILLLVSIAAMLGGCDWFLNKAPVAVISANPTSGEAPLEVTFDASESYDPDGDEISYEWDFGDGKGAEREIVQHGFGSARSYTVRLLVTDSKGKSDTSSVSISISQPPDENTKDHTFEAQSGTEYDTGTGLKVSVPPASTGGTSKLVVTENPTPQQPEGDFIELLSVYSVSVIQEGSSPAQRIATQDNFPDPPPLTLIFEIPPGVDPCSAMILHWTDEGWVLADNKEGLPGGEVSPDGKYISIVREHLSTFALAQIGSNLDQQEEDPRADRAINWALSQIDPTVPDGESPWSGWCLTFVATAYGGSVSTQWSSALALYNDLKKEGKIVPAKWQTDSSAIPRGALLFWNNPPDGHVAIYIGNGNLVHATAGGVRKDRVGSENEPIGNTWVFPKAKYFRGWAPHAPNEWLFFPILLSPGLNSAPGQSIDTLTPTFRWEEVPNADRYAIFVSTPVNNDWEHRRLVFNSKDSDLEITGTSYRLPSGKLEWGKNYRWNMKAHCPEGWGSISERLYFHTSSADSTPPTVNAFSVHSSSVTLGNAFTISYTVSDTGGSGLNWAGLWRATDSNGNPVDWIQVKTTSISGNSHSGSFSDAPPSADTYWYGVYVGDNAGNWNDEKNSQTGGSPGVYGPIKVEVSAPPGNILTGTIQVNAILDGRPWEGLISYFRLSGPQNWRVEGAAMVPAVFRDLPPGIWTLKFHSGGPSGATFTSVSPSSPQNLTAGRTITFTLNFVTTRPNQPRASFTATPSSGEVPLTVDFDASGSSDSDGTITSYRWDFGDGNTGSGVTVSHEYTRVTFYVVVLMVIDDKGATDSASQTITVTAPGNILPSASFTATPSSGEVPLTVDFDASGSSDSV